MQVRIVKPGLQTTIQDLGRNQYLPDAVPLSGAMDSLAARIANLAVGNECDAAVIEFTYANAAFYAESDSLIAWSGDGAFFTADDVLLPADRPVFIPQGTLIELKNSLYGSRSYMAIAGGWRVPVQLGSRSTYLSAGLGGFKGRALQSGDELSNLSEMTPLAAFITNRLKGAGIKYPKWSIPRSLLLPENKKVIRIVPAHEFVWFKGSSIVNFLSEAYTLSQHSNRMGYQLDGPLIERLIQDELLSTAVTPGTIQVTNSGALVLLMADCQTTGGYPRIAQVPAVDLPLCGQLKPGDAIFFKEISRDEAEMLYIERETQFQQLKQAVSNRILQFNL